MVKRESTLEEMTELVKNVNTKKLQLIDAVIKEYMQNDNSKTLNVLDAGIREINKMLEDWGKKYD